MSWTTRATRRTRSWRRGRSERRRAWSPPPPTRRTPARRPVHARATSERLGERDDATRASGGSQSPSPFPSPGKGAPERACARCTLLNAASRRRCGVRDAPRDAPRDAEDPLPDPSRAEFIREPGANSNPRDGRRAAPDSDSATSRPPQKALEGAPRNPLPACVTISEPPRDVSRRRLAVSGEHRPRVRAPPASARTLRGSRRDGKRERARRAKKETRRAGSTRASDSRRASSAPRTPPTTPTRSPRFFGRRRLARRAARSSGEWTPRRHVARGSGESPLRVAAAALARSARAEEAPEKSTERYASMERFLARREDDSAPAAPRTETATKARGVPTADSVDRASTRDGVAPGSRDGDGDGDPAPKSRMRPDATLARWTGATGAEWAQVPARDPARDPGDTAVPGLRRRVRRVAPGNTRPPVLRRAVREGVPRQDPRRVSRAPSSSNSSGACASRAGSTATRYSPGCSPSRAFPRRVRALERARAPRRGEGWGPLLLLRARGAIARAPRAGNLWQADHIVPVAEGGGECGLENFRTLCDGCHRRATSDLRARMRLAAAAAAAEGTKDIRGFLGANAS